MPHPNGSQGNPLAVVHSFEQAYQFIGNAGTILFITESGEQITASHGVAGDGVTPTIVLTGERNIHGRVCHACWGFSLSCTGERVGHAITPLDTRMQNIN